MNRKPATQCTNKLDAGDHIAGATTSNQHAEDLLLLAVATGLKPVCGWQAAGVTQKQLKQLKHDQATRLAELRKLAALGGSYPAPLLTDLLKAQLAQRLLTTDSVAELERLAKITERLPQEIGKTSASSSPGRGSLRHTSNTTCTDKVDTTDLNADIDGMELQEALAEAKQLIAQLEETHHG